MDDSTPGSKSQARRRPWRIILLGVLLLVPATLYGGVMGYMYFRQADLIFFGKVTQGRVDSLVKPPRWAEHVDLTPADGDTIAALFAPAADADGLILEDASHRPTVLYFYGSGHSLSRCVSMLDALRRDGLNVLIPEYVGYGMSTGDAGERGCRATADAAYGYLMSRNDIDHSRIIVEGGSLGAAVAIDLASRVPVAGLVAMSGFTSLVEMSQLQYPWLPVKYLLKHPFDSLSKIGRVRCPVLITHGTNDELIPYSMSMALAHAASGGAMHQSIPGAGHNDTLYLAGVSGGLLPTHLRGPYHRFTPEVHHTIRDYFSRVLSDPPQYQILPAGATADSGRR